MKKLLPLLLLLAAPSTALATGFTDTGQDIIQRESTEITLDGALRLRTAMLHNLDLDRGLTPSGTPLFPVPLSDPTAQNLTHADMRLRTDLAIYAPGGGIAVKLRLDTLDNLELGSTPNTDPASSTTQISPQDPVKVKRAYGEALTPLGLIVAGRTGSQWGLGMLANGGDCPDCDSGDAADRLSFITPAAGHIWAVAYDFSATGFSIPRPNRSRTVDIDPNDDVRTFTFAFLKWRSDRSLERRKTADKWTLDYGAYVSHRWQDQDTPTTYLPAETPSLTPSQVVERGYTATAGDVWLRLVTPKLRIEMEAAVLIAESDQTSLLPGVLVRDPARSTQFGAALESLYGSNAEGLAFGLDAGFASGDSTPGFGAFEGVNAAPAQPGDLEGPQGNPPYDNEINNFRFHSDYRIDRILFREIIGTVTDAIYVRPHIAWRTRSIGAGTLTASLAGVWSQAVEKTSPPGGKAPLGIEIDPTLSYQSRDGFELALEHAIFFPMAGLDNPRDNLQARSAQLLRLRLGYQF